MAPGVTLANANFTVEGPGGFSSAGTVSVGSSADVSIVLGHLPVGQGYVASIDTLASDGLTRCSGSTAFDVTDGSAVFTVVVHLDCGVPVGDVSVQATLNVCPVIDSLDASPLDVALGGVSNLTLSAHDSDTGPGPLSYGWAVNGIRLTRQTASSLGFTCTTSGEVTIAGIVSDGDLNPACADTAVAKVSCQ